VLDEFRQVTMGLEFSTAQLRGEKLDGPGVRARRDADAGKPKTRASMVCAQLSDEPLCPPPAPSQVEGIQLCGRRHRFASLLLPWS
jgi:hypothetical protein